MTETVSISTKAEPRAPSRWSQDRRIEFIDFRLRWEGRLNRSDLTAHFSISIPQASLDIAKYIELAPENMSYNKSARVYVAGDAFVPLFPSSSASQYLNELLSVQTGLLGPEASFLGWMPTMDVVPTPGRQLNSDTLAALVSAIRGQRPVSVLYQSMAQAAPQPRTISPHALANDGFRWHVRAFCHLRQQFRDFVIARMLNIDASADTYVEPAADEHWARTVELRITPNPELAEAHRRVIEMDYGMVEGRAVLDCRQALLFYALKHLGLDQLTGGSPKAHQVVLENRSEIEPLLAGHSG
jgi:hypothetical protein